jgi:hypothetical protein
MRFTRLVVLFTSLLIAGSCGSPRATENGDGLVSVVGDAPSCSSCRIVVDSVAWLPRPQDTVALATGLEPAVDSRGQYLGIDATRRQAVHVFAPDGSLLRTFGKPGRGPGEFSSVQMVKVGRADTLFVFEYNRVLVFSPSYEYVREFRGTELVDPRSAITLGNGDFLVQFAPNHFSILHPNGTLDSASMRAIEERSLQRAQAQATRSTPAGPPVMVGIRLQDVDSTSCNQCGARAFDEASRSRGGGIWSGAMHQYVVERHDMNGVLQRRIVRKAEFFPPWPSEPGSGHGAHGEFAMESAVTNEMIRREVSKTRLIGVREDDDGLIWTQVYHQDPGNPIPPNADFMAEMMSESMALEKHLVTTVEVIDPRRGALLARAALPGVVRPLGSDLFAEIMIGADGDRSIKVIRLRLARD